MLKGRYEDSTGRPHLEGRLALPRLKISGDISFLIDTGADKTVLMPMDARRLKVDYKKLGGTAQSLGIGGISKAFVESALLTFADS